MTYRGCIAALLASLAGMMVAPAAGAQSTAGTPGVVFVQTNQSGGNQIVVYDTASNGRLSRAGTTRPAATAAPPFREPSPII